jgi:protein-tyrosine phosphatase
MTEDSTNISVLFVCMGNICRSPSAEGVFRKMVEDAGLGAKVEVDSAGTHAYHVGHPPDQRAADAAERRGFSLDNIRARRIHEDDYRRFDYILAMDELNLHIILENAVEEHSAEISLFMDYVEGSDFPEVPDPYYGGTAGFEKVLDLLEEASQNFLASLQQKI